MEKSNNNKANETSHMLTLEILLYLNIFYFGLYAGMELLFLVIKFYHVNGLSTLTFVNETFGLLVVVIIESLRLFIGQQENLPKKLSAIFRILVLTVPSLYGVFYFTFWQAKITRLDVILGMIMLLVQSIELVCAFVAWFPNRHRISYNPLETDFDKLD